MFGVELFPDVSILIGAFHYLLHGLIELLKRIPYLCSHLIDVGDPLNG